jgi:hypothetical protein
VTAQHSSITNHQSAIAPRRIAVIGGGISGLAAAHRVFELLPEAELVLICDLVGGKDVPRMPLETEEKMVIAGVSLPLLKLAPFEASAPLKLKMALLRAAPDNAN